MFNQLLMAGMDQLATVITMVKMSLVDMSVVLYLISLVVGVTALTIPLMKDAKKKDKPVRKSREESKSVAVNRLMDMHKSDKAEFEAAEMTRSYKTNSFKETVKETVGAVNQKLEEYYQGLASQYSPMYEYLTSIQ